MPGPTEFSQHSEPLVVEIETAVGSSVFRVDPRWRVQEVRLESDGTLSSAMLAVRLDDDFDGPAARQAYYPDRRVLVRTNEAEPGDRTYLIEGYPRWQETSWSGRPGSRKDEFGVRIEHVGERLRRDRACQIYGRRMRSAAIEDGLIVDPATWRDKSILVETLACVFNADGRANCSPTPLITEDADGSPRTIYIFTYDNDFAARTWTYLNAIRYLYWFYSLAGGPVSVGNLLDATEAYVHVGPDERFSISGGGHLIQLLLQEARPVSCEGGNLLAALVDVVREAGVHLAVETVNAAGAVRSQLRLWAAQDGAVKNLRLARGGRFPDGAPRFNVQDKSAGEILEANNVYKALIQWNSQRIINAPMILGGGRRYEFTLPLVPGWIPETGLDNVAPPDRPAAKAVVIPEELIPTLGQDPNNFDWYRKYHKFGNDFAQYKNVGRKWVLNEAGTYAPAKYNRNAPFDDYQPFEWSTVADDDVATPGQWARRKRLFFDSITREFLEKGAGVYPEVSFDSGVTWYPMLFSGIGALLFEVGVYFGTINLTSITPPLTDPLEQNMWWAIIDQTFRVRVTGVIESDRRLSHAWPADAYFTPTVQVHSRIVDRSGAFKFVTREGVTNVLTQPGEELGSLEADDSTDLVAYAAEYAQADHDRRSTVLPAIPWLETGYRIGDQIGKVAGREIELSRRVGYDTRYPVIVGVTWRLGEAYETELSIT